MSHTSIASKTFPWDSIEQHRGSGRVEDGFDPVDPFVGETLVLHDIKNEVMFNLVESLIKINLENVHLFFGVMADDV